MTTPFHWEESVYQIETPGGRQWVAWGQRAGGEAAGWFFGGHGTATEYLPVTRCAAAAKKAAPTGEAEPWPRRPRASAGQRLGQGFRFEEGAESLAGGARIGLPDRGSRERIARDLRQREVARRQSSPYTGKPSARPAGKPGNSFASRRICDDPFLATRLPRLSSTILRRLSMRF